MTTFGPKPEQQGAPLSKGTRALLDEMMRGQNVTAFRRKKLEQSIQEDAALPTRLPKTARKCPKAAWRPLPAPPPPTPIVQIHGTRQVALSCGKKPLRSILRENPPAREQFRGAPCGRDQEAEKDRLARIMQFKGEPPVLVNSRPSAGTPLRGQRARESASEMQGPETDEQIADRLLEEVEERRVFLDEMRGLGKGGAYDARILGEIALRLKQLEGLKLSDSEK